MASKHATKPHKHKKVSIEKERPFYFARKYNEKHVMDAIQKSQARPHDYFGYIFSATSDRPPNYYRNYFLPIYNQPTVTQHVHILGPPVPKERLLNPSEAPSNTMPLSTVKVQWGVHKRGTVYKPEDIYNYFSRYRQVLAVYQWTVNSCLVVFSSLIDAKSVVTNPHLGAPWGHLVVSWHDHRLNNNVFYYKNVEIQEKIVEQLAEDLARAEQEASNLPI